MSKIFSNIVNEHLERTICKLCSIIEKQVLMEGDCDWSEKDLRKELVACILGSQVRFEMATEALKYLENDSLLDDCWWKGGKLNFEEKVFNVLSGKKISFHKKWCYRFPKAKSIQISKARDAVAVRPLLDRIKESSDPIKLRKSLVRDISGIGPKQASMYLRNVGVSYDLAILDTHVLSYFDIKRLINHKETKINTIKAYENTEKIVMKYANEMGYPTGYVDLAIWATIKAANEIFI